MKLTRWVVAAALGVWVTGLVPVVRAQWQPRPTPTPRIIFPTPTPPPVFTPTPRPSPSPTPKPTLTPTPGTCPGVIREFYFMPGIPLNLPPVAQPLRFEDGTEFLIIVRFAGAGEVPFRLVRVR